MKNRHKILLFFCFILTLSLFSVNVFAYDISQILSFEIDGAQILRSGNNVIFRVILTNMDNETNVTVSGINIFNSNNILVNSYKEDFALQPIGKLQSYIEDLKSKQVYPNKTEEDNIADEIKKGTFLKSFSLDIHDLSSSLDIGSNITFSVDVEVTYNNNTYNLTKSNQILISEDLGEIKNVENENQKEMIGSLYITRLPTVIGNLCSDHGWCAGDQHLHSNYTGNIVDLWDQPPIPDIVKQSKQLGLKWVIITDHVYDLDSSEPEKIIQQCNNETSSDFICIEGEEGATNANGCPITQFFVASHYLIYGMIPYYGGGYCPSSPLPQEMINYVKNLGGLGFIAHPFSTPTWDNWDVKNYTGIEIFNGDYADKNVKAINKWFQLLSSGGKINDNFVVGLGNSDAHDLSSIAKGFSYCYVNSLTKSEILNAIKNGRCVASDGPLVTFKIKSASIGEMANVCSGTNKINVNVYSNIEFGTLNKISVYIDGTPKENITLSGYTDSMDIDGININPTNKFMSLELQTSNGKRAFTNPIWLNVTSACIDNDGCCPSGCVLSNDNDCAPVPISCTGSTAIHSCSSFNSISSINSISLSDTRPNPGKTITATINWTGWHYGDPNHWAFFLDSSTTPINTCNSFQSDTNIQNVYSMSCSITIPSNTAIGLHQLKVTANDAPGYCNPGETGTDAEVSTIINITSYTIPKNTFMVYLDADNDLESFGIGDINEMEMVGSTSETTIIVQIDRATGYDTSNGDWKSARRYLINRDTDENTISSTLLDDLGEVDMANPNTLVNFTTWAMQNYPAEKYILVLWNHGSGWKYVTQPTTKPWEDKKSLEELQPQKEIEKPVKGIIVDFSSGNTLSLEELKQALNSIKTNTNKTIDLLGFDACLMQMAEVNYQVRNFSKVVVGSEQTEPGDGWPYDLILSNLTNNPDWNIYQIGDNIVSNYMASYSSTSDVTQSAVNQTKILNLITRINNFAQVLSNNLVNYKVQIKNVREISQSYNDDDYIDLYHFAQLIKSNIPDVTIQSAANQVMESINETVFAEAHGSGSPNSHGLTIYFPKTKIEFMFSYKTIDFSTDTNWDDFLEKYYSNSQIVPNTHILLVDDDNGKNYEEFYKNALNYWIQLGYGYDYSYWDAYSDGSPTLSLLSNYSLIIWFTGDDWSTTLTTFDQENLASYLDNGGNLFISGQDIGFDIGTSGPGESSISFIGNYLHADFLLDDTNDDYVNGIFGDPISSGLSLNLSGRNNNYPSAISSLVNATSIFKYVTNGSTSGLRYSGNYKIVYLAFPFEAINNNQTQATLIDKIISWINPTLSDIYAPVPYGYSIDLGYNQPGGEVTIRTRVYEKNQISSVVAEIENPDEHVIKDLNLFDDGLHGDYEPNDGVYGNKWTTSLEEDYFVDLVTKDSIGNEQTWNNMLRFTTKPFNMTSKVLVIHPGSYWNYYSDALIANSYTYDLYNISERGVPYTSLLSNYVNGVVVWIQPFGGPDKTSQERLIQYLDLKGNLFISGQDIGWYIFGYGGEINNSLYNNYLRATYVQDDSNLYALNGTNGDSIGDGIVKMWIAGGNGADNQYWPSEIDPRGEAKIIFRYDPNSTIIGKSIKTDYITDELYKSKQKIGNRGILSSGTAAISVNSTYKIIYFAFGFEAINNTNDRNLVMDRVMNWLMPSCIPNWVLNDTWTGCIEGVQYKYYYDNNNCNKTETMPLPLNRTCEFIEIRSPKNINYDQRKIFVNVSTLNKSKYIYASLNGERFSKVCSDCNSITYTDYAREGSNELIVKSIRYDNSSNSTSVNFSVDTIKPTISTITPKNKEYSKGITNFTIKYTENNLENISIFYGASALHEFVMKNCTPGRNKECSAEIDLSLYDGKQVQYYVVVRDQIHATPSKNSTIFIDNTKPVIQMTSPENKIYDVRSVRLNVSVSEKVKLEKSTDEGRFTTLCSNCNSYDRTTSFSQGLHNLTIRATDKAGNEAYESVIFWTGERLLTLTMKPISGITMYNSSSTTSYSTINGLNGLEISVDVFGKEYVLFNATPNSNTFDGIFSWTAYYDVRTGKIIQSTAPIRPLNGNSLFQFWLPCGVGTTCILNASFSNTALISNMGIYNSTQKQVVIAYNNKTAARANVVPELILGAKAAKAEPTDVQATIKGKLIDIGLESYDKLTDLGIVVVSPRTNANSDKIILKLPF